MVRVLGDFQPHPRAEHKAAWAGLHKGGAGRIADTSRGSGVREDEQDTKTRRRTPCLQTTRQNAQRARVFGHLVVDIDVKASRKRYGAERADPRSRLLEARRGHASSKEPRGTAVRGGRDPPTKNFEGPPANYDRSIYKGLRPCIYICVRRRGG